MDRDLTKEEILGSDILSVGPFTINVRACREAGWAYQQIKTAVDVITATASYMSSVAGSSDGGKEGT